MNYEEGQKVREFLKDYASSLQQKITILKDFKWKLNHASTQSQWTASNGFRLSFYRGDSLLNSTQINITFWASWDGGIFIKDNERLIFDNSKLLSKLKNENKNIDFVEDKLDIMAIRFNNGMPKEIEVIDALKKLINILQNVGLYKNNGEIKDTNENMIINPLDFRIKKKSEIKSVLGVEV